MPALAAPSTPAWPTRSRPKPNRARRLQELAARKVDIVKIWVDDRNGRAPKLRAPLYRAIIDEAPQAGLNVNAHVFYHADAVDLVDAGIDGFAHLVRDMVMDDALVAAIVKRGVYVMGNLSSPAQSTYASLPQWLSPRRSDGAAADGVGERAGPRSPARLLFEARSEGGRRRAAALRILEQSLAKLERPARNSSSAPTPASKIISSAWPSSSSSQAMVDAGMTPAPGHRRGDQPVGRVSPAEDQGHAAPGRDADFIVLDANPLDAITNTRRIARVVINGVEIDRAHSRRRSNDQV